MLRISWWQLDRVDICKSIRIKLASAETELSSVDLCQPTEKIQFFFITINVLLNYLGFVSFMFI